VPGTTIPCYEGPEGTEGIGICRAGTKTCLPTSEGFGACEGEIRPASEVCSNDIDENCNGGDDGDVDSDGDGWIACGGDCCDTATVNCPNPTHVNPGALEVSGNGIDDDCDPSTADDAPPPDCSSAALFSEVAPLDMARSMELCQTTTANPPLAFKKWGVVNAAFRTASGADPGERLSDMRSQQSAVLQNYGVTFPMRGATMAGMSTGVMRDQSDGGFSGLNTSFSSGIEQGPSAYLAAHGGVLPSSAACGSTCNGGTRVADSVNLRLVVRVPTNVNAFSLRHRFFSVEYLNLCSGFNDRALELLTSLAPEIPQDRNIAFDSFSDALTAYGTHFESCAPRACYTCPLGVAGLAGTGLTSAGGAGTVWLETTAPVVPGETITLELMVFDVGDGGQDSIVLFDDFRWVPISGT
jgi:hypothetical protein